MRKVMTRLIVAALASSALLHAQLLEVASIKQNKSDESRVLVGGPASRFTATNAPAQILIMYAFGVQDFKTGAPPVGVKTDRGDTTGKPTATSPAPAGDDNDPHREVLRELLRDRFKLTAHMETREKPIY